MDFAVIGAGRMGRRHMEAGLSLGLRLVAVVDPNEKNLRDAVAATAVKCEPFCTIEDFYATKARPEFVVVATTAEAHGASVASAVKHGAKYVLCEKPMAQSLQDCTAMIELCATTGTKLAVNHQMRVMDQYVAIKQILSERAIGDLNSVTVVAGNFGLAMNATHYFELFRWLTGEQIETVTAWLSDERVPNPRGPQFEDRAGALRAVTRSGRRLYVEASADQGHGLNIVYACRNGTIVTDELMGRLRLSIRKADVRAEPTTRYGLPADVQDMDVTPADTVTPTKRVMENLLAGRDYPTGEDGRAAVATLVAAHVSHESGHASVGTSLEQLPVARRFAYA